MKPYAQESEENVRLRVASYREKYLKRQLFTFSIPTDAVKYFTDRYKGHSFETLIDRATRKQNSDRVTLWPNVRSAAPRGAKIAYWASNEYSRHSSGIEVQVRDHEDEKLFSAAREIAALLQIPIERVEHSLIFLPKGFYAKVENITPVTFIYNLSSTEIILQPDNCHCSSFLFEAAYLPEESPVALSVNEEVAILKITIKPLRLVDLYTRELACQLLQSGGSWAKVMKSLSLDTVGDLEAAHSTISEAWLRVDLRNIRHDWMEYLAIDGLEKQIRRPPPNIGLLYPEREWGIEGIRRRPDDIHIVTFRRSGTTWMQMLMYQLLTDGNIDRISHIYEFSPYPHLELRRVGSAKRIENLPSPRVIKSHSLFEGIYSRQGKYIYVARDGMDVAISSYHHHFHSGGGPLPFDIYFDRFLTEKGGWFDHVKGWYKNRARKNILFLTYGDMIKDIQGVAKQVAGFCNIEISAEAIARVTRYCSIAYMRENEEKFDSNSGSMWLQKISGSKFIRDGIQFKGRAALSLSQKERFSEIFAKELAEYGLQLNR